MADEKSGQQESAGEESVEWQEAGGDALEPEAQEESGAEALAECEERYLRMHAEFENVKRRMEKEKARAIEYAYERFARDLLPVLDSLELALASIPTEEETDDEHLGKLREGIGLTRDQFIKTLSKHHIELISLENGFDPNFHEAVMQIESEAHDSGQIVQELQKGYRLKERILRPSMVSVAK